MIFFFGSKAAMIVLPSVSFPFRCCSGSSSPEASLRPNTSMFRWWPPTSWLSALLWVSTADPCYSWSKIQNLEKPRVLSFLALSFIFAYLKSFFFLLLLLKATSLLPVLFPFLDNLLSYYFRKWSKPPQLVKVQPNLIQIAVDILRELQFEN